MNITQDKMSLAERLALPPPTRNEPQQHCCWRTSTNQSKRQRCRKATQQQQQQRQRQQLAAILSGLVIHSILPMILLLLVPYTAIDPSTRTPFAHGAVIRPTIFSDLPPDSPTTSLSNSQPQAAAAAANQPANSNNNNNNNITPIKPNPIQAPGSTPNNGANHQHQHNHRQPGQQHHNQHHSQHQADGPQTQKITPLKSKFCVGPNNVKLDQALGLQSYAIDDLSLSASSFSNERVRPNLARLNLDVLGGAWCPHKPISASNFGKEWIQVKLNRSFVISAIETQGRFALGSGKEFVPSYSIEYSRNNGQTWHSWKDFRGGNLLKANDDVNTGVRNELSPPIVGANVIRILPYSQHLRTVCLRFELYGCQYDEGAPIAYSTMNGVVEPRWGFLTDYTYDGLLHRTGLLSGGLGQLVDGVKGPDNFSINQGLEWVGWKSMNGDVVIEFTFKTLRNFTGALFHSNNLFSSGVEVFQAVDVHYGIDISLSMDSLRDSLVERERRLRHHHHQQASASAEAGVAANGGVLSRQVRQTSGNEADFLAALAASTGSGGGGGAHSAPGNTVWSQDVLSIEYEPDKKAESSRPVTVHLKQRLANKLRFNLKFASKWILLSEVEFLSRPVELMSLASLNEQLTPRLMLDLQQQAKTYDQYVAILREHQLRRIAAEQYLQMNGGVSSSSSGSGSSTPSSTLSVGGDTSTNNVEPPQLNDQVPSPSQPTPANMNSMDDYLSNAGKQLPLGSGASGPATNPLLTIGSMYPAPPNAFGPASNSIDSQPSSGIIFDKILANQMTNSGNSISEQPERTGSRPASGSGGSSSSSRQLGLATVISFVFVALLGLLGILFAISSYRLRCRSPKLGSPTALPRHAHLRTGKSFMNSVFAQATNTSNIEGGGSGSGGGGHSSSDSSAGSSAGSFGHAHQANGGQYLAGAAHMMNAGASAYQQTTGSGDSHYNPLFASTSGRSSEGSLRQAKVGGVGALSTLKKLASLTTGRGGGRNNNNNNNSAAKEANLMFRHHQASLMHNHLHHHHHQQQQQPSQLLVSLKDSVSSQTSSQAITAGQLIVGLNQVNPLAHQQIYNQQAIYGQAAAGSNSMSSPTTISSAPSMSAANGNKLVTGGGGGVGDYSLTTSTDYATPDLQPALPQQQQQQHATFLEQTPFGLRNSTRLPAHNYQQRMLMSEHNYEQISGDQQHQQQQQQPQHQRFNNTTLHHVQHQRTFSNQMQVPQVPQASGTMYQPDAWRLATQPRQQQQQQALASSSHYYYADTDAAKSCLASAADSCGSK